MGYSGQNSRGSQRWRIFLALVCVLLVVMAGTVQAAHGHADGAASHAGCSLCVAAHITVHLGQTLVHAPGVAVVVAVEADPPTVVPFTLSTFALFTRPPPVASIPA